MNHDYTILIISVLGQCDDIFGCPFIQYFTSSFFVRKCLFEAFLCLQFVFVFLGQKEMCKNVGEIDCRMTIVIFINIIIIIFIIVSAFVPQIGGSEWQEETVATT